MVQTFVFTTRYFLILVVALIILINSPVIFSSATARPALIDVTAVLGSIATVAIFFMNTLLTYSGRRQGEGLLAFTTGSFLWLGAELTWAYYREGLGVEVPYPSAAI